MENLQLTTLLSVWQAANLSVGEFISKMRCCPVHLVRYWFWLIVNDFDNDIHIFRSMAFTVTKCAEKNAIEKEGESDLPRENIDGT